MKSVTVEFQRFGDDVGIARLSERYLRTVGGQPAETVTLPLQQDRLARAMRCFDYSRLSGDASTREQVRSVADDVLGQLRTCLADVLPLPAPGGLGADDVWQLDVVTQALELAQLPFEALESEHNRFVVTRRVRQPWPRPEVVRDASPKVLFAWAAPLLRAGSSRRMDVPHEAHRGLLREVLAEWLEADPSALVEVPHATWDGLKEQLARPGHGFTHVHLLAHGVGPSRSEEDPTARFDLTAAPPSPTYLALEDRGGLMHKVAPPMLAELVPAGAPRPATFAIATCHSGEVDPMDGGGTLAHVLHASGVPVVVASQLALTQAGSSELISTFLARVLDGGDPRLALRTCRDRLRERGQETYYDQVALVGYVHLEEDFERRHDELVLQASLARLKAASKAAVRAAREAGERVQQGGEVGDTAPIARRFEAVRASLEGLDPARLSVALQGERLGLIASSLKREAEAAHALSRVLSGETAAAWADRSRTALLGMHAAYGEAAALSRDDHWTGVQSLLADALTTGSLAGRERHWAAAWVAADDKLRAGTVSGANSALLMDAVWACGSLAELELLAPLLGDGRDPAVCDRAARKHLDDLVRLSAQAKAAVPPESMAGQLARYSSWWGQDPAIPLPTSLVSRAEALGDHLASLTGP